MRLFIVLGCIMTLSACALRPAGPSVHALPSPCDSCIEGVSNFTRVSPALWRGSQPDAAGFRALEQAGVKTIISLRSHHDDLPLMAGTKLHYINIPMYAWRPTEDNLIRFLQAVKTASADPALSPVFVHCQQGRDRTGYSIAAYRMVQEGWSANEAIQEMFDFRFNRIWMGNPDFLQQLDVEKIRSVVNDTP